MPLLDPVSEGPPRLQNRAERRVLGGDAIEHILRLLPEGRHQLGRELSNLGELLDLLEIGLVEHVVGRDGVDVGVGGSILDCRLVLGRQIVPQRERDLHFEGGAWLPPPGVIVEELAAELIQAEDEVIGRTDEFCGVDGSGLDRGQDLPAGYRDLLPAQIGQHVPRQARNTHLEALEVGNGVDLLGEPAAHLAAGATGREGDDAVLLGIELVEQVEAASLVEPGVLLALGQAEGNRRPELLDRAQPDVVVGGRVAHLHTTVTNRRQYFETADDLASGAGIDLELATRELAYLLGEELGGPEEGDQ